MIGTKEAFETFELARDLSEAARIIRGWRDGGAEDVSLLCIYHAARDYGDAIMRAAETAEEDKPTAIDHPLGALIPAPAVIRLPGLGPVIAAGPLLTAIQGNGGGEERIRLALQSIGIPESGVSGAAAAIAEGHVLVANSDGMSERGGDSRAARRREGTLSAPESRVVPAELVEGPRQPQTPTAEGREAEPPYSEISPRYLREIPLDDVLSVDASVGLDDAMHRLRELAEPFLPVVSRGRVVGILTSEDVPARRRPKDEASIQLTAEDVMIEHFVHCFEDETAADAAELMERLHVSQLLVLDRKQRLLGIIRSKAELSAGRGDPQLSD